MKGLRSFMLGLGIIMLFGIAGYYSALAEPLQALARNEKMVATLRQTVADARALTREQTQLQLLNQRLRRTTGAVPVGVTKQTFAAALARISQDITLAGGNISGIYPQEGRQVCGFRILTNPNDAITLVRQVEQTLAWHCERLEAQRAADGRLELYLLLAYAQ